MKLPEFNTPTMDKWPVFTEPDQAIDLKTIIYRVSNGQDTGLARVGLQLYGEDDGDDPYYNGMSQDILEVMEDEKHLREAKIRMKQRERYSKITNLKRSSKTDERVLSTEENPKE